MEEVNPFVWVKLEEREPPCNKAVAILTFDNRFDSAYMDCDGDFHGELEDFYIHEDVAEWLDEGLRE